MDVTFLPWPTIPLFEPSGLLVGQRSSSVVAAMVKRGSAEFFGGRGRVRGATLRPRVMTPDAVRKLKGRSTSHNHETGDNPRGVWTLRQIPSEAASLFSARHAQ